MKNKNLPTWNRFFGSAVSPKGRPWLLKPPAILSTLLLPLGSYAQDAISFMNEANAQIRSIGSILYQVIVGVLGLVALVSLVNVGIRIQNSDREGTSKAIGWCAGIIFCIVMALVLKNFLGL